jgi:PPOX class probable F420-dependent enzyme
LRLAPPASAHAVALRRSWRYGAAMLSDVQRRFLDQSRVAHLATADRAGAPHLVPVCFCLSGLSLYITVDEKPKRTDIPLKRIRNIQENPAVAVTVDRWDEDWTRLAWIMLRGPAEILSAGGEHDQAQDQLRGRYPQYRTMHLAALPVIAVRISRVLSWGALG